VGHRDLGGGLKFVALIFYGLLLTAFLWMNSIFREANAHLSWVWRPDALAQSFAGMAFFSGFALYYQVRSRRFSELLALQYFGVGVLALGACLFHAFPAYSSAFGVGHFVAIAIFAGWDLFRGRDVVKPKA